MDNSNKVFSKKKKGLFTSIILFFDNIIPKPRKLSLGDGTEVQPPRSADSVRGRHNGSIMLRLSSANGTTTNACLSL